MILLVHMLFGAAIGSAINNVYLAIILAFLGHYFLDMFPHVEYIKSAENSIQKLKSATIRESLKDTTKVFVDFLLGLLAVFMFSNNSPIIYLCALVAIVPDGITVIHTLFPTKLLTPHQNIHTAIQYLTKQKKFPVAINIATQATAIIISILILNLR